MRPPPSTEATVAMNARSATMNGESLWSRLAGLALIVEGCEYDRLHAMFAYESERVTTQVAVRRLRTLRVGGATDVWRWHGRARRGPRADRAARRFVPRRCAQRRGAERVQRGRPAGRSAGQPAGAAPRGHRLSLGGVDAHSARTARARAPHTSSACVIALVVGWIRL